MFGDTPIQPHSSPEDSPARMNQDSALGNRTDDDNEADEKGASHDPGMGD